MEYYFLGLEANLRDDNRYVDLDKATEKAAWISSKRKVPIRVFKMWPNKKYSHARTISPNDALDILKDYEKVKERVN